MTVQYLQGFEGWSDPETYYLQGSGSAFYVDVTGGRFGGHALANASSGGGQVAVILRNFDSWAAIGSGPGGVIEDDAAIVGFAYKFTPAGKATIIAQWVDTHPLDGVISQVELNKNANDLLTISSNGVTLATGTHPLLANRYYYLEWKARVRTLIIETGGTSAGAVTASDPHTNQVRIDGVLDIDLADSPAIGYVPLPGHVPATGAAYTAYIARLSMFYLCYGQFQLYQWFDDVYVCNLLGTTGIDFLGDVSVNRLVPTPTGVPSAGHDSWVLQAGASKNLAVAEIPPDGDTSYVNSGTVGAVQSFMFPNMKPNSLAIPAVIVTANVRKDNLGSRYVDALVRVGSNEFQTPSNNPGAGVAITDLYTPIPYAFAAFPDGSADGTPWNEAALNAVEAGVKFTA